MLHKDIGLNVSETLTVFVFRSKQIVSTYAFNIRKSKFESALQCLFLRNNAL
jgi:hypothetical protein